MYEVGAPMWLIGLGLVVILAAVVVIIILTNRD
jgi:hypothetical protein